MKIIAPVEKLAHLELKIENGYPTKNTSAVVATPPCNFNGTIIWRILIDGSAQGVQKIRRITIYFRRNEDGEN